MQKENAQIVKISKRGFTLLELLIVIGILAILATTVTIILNPAELLRQARDSQRLSDLQSLNTAINLYTSTVTASPLFSGTSTLVGGTCSVGAVTDDPFGTAQDCNPMSGSYGTAVDSTGWVTIAFTQVPTGAPLSRLPLDPLNTTTNYYGFKASSTNNVWEINGRLESNKYAVQDNLMGNDGGNKNNCGTPTAADCLYEIGSDPGLNL